MLHLQDFLNASTLHKELHSMVLSLDMVVQYQHVLVIFGSPLVIQLNIDEAIMKPSLQIACLSV